MVCGQRLLPVATRDVAGELGDLRALAGQPVGVQRCLPRLPGHVLQRVEDGRPAAQSDGVAQVELVQVLDEAVRAGAAVAAHHDPAAQIFGQLGKSVVQHGDVVGGVVRAGLARPEHRGQALPGATQAVVGEGQQRGEPEAPLEGGLRTFLVRVRVDQRRVQVDDQPPVRRGHRLQLPDLRSRLRPGAAERGQRGVRVGGERGDQPRHGRVRGHVTEQLRLAADRGQVGQAVTAQRDRDREIEQHLARIVPGTDRSPRRERLRQGARQPHQLSGLQQQPTAG
jgi:hypothetical protein